MNAIYQRQYIIENGKLVYEEFGGNYQKDYLFHKLVDTLASEGKFLEKIVNLFKFKKEKNDN